MIRRANDTPERPRLSREERARAIERLDIALREERLDLVEYAELVRAVEGATTRASLASTLADLPDRPGVRQWQPHLRVRAADRRHAVGWLADAVAEGSLTAEEHERRLAAATAATRYERLQEALDGVPGQPSAERDRLLVTAADRQAVVARLDRALAEERLGADDHADLEARLSRAQRYGDLDGVVAELDDITRRDVWEQAVRRLDEALTHGQIDEAEHARRLAAVRAVGRNADIPPLLADLSGPMPETALRWVSRLPKSRLATRRLTDTDRRQARLLIEGALRDGRLTLAEYDERSRLASQAKVGLDLPPLIADLLDPGEPPAPNRATARRTSPQRTAAQRATPWWGFAARLASRRRTPWRRPTLVPLALGLVVVVALASWLTGRDGPGPSAGQAAPTATSTAAHAPTLTEAWAAPADRPDHSESIGAWFTGGAVVRARVDRLVAYDAADGHQQWVFQPPDGQQLCAMSRDTGHGVGLVGYGVVRPPTGCATVAAIDLDTGEPLWHRRRVMPQVRYLNTRRDLPQVGHLDLMPSVDEMAVAADVAVIRDANAFVALGLRGDGQRWRSTAPAGCWPYSATGASHDLVLIVDCQRGNWWISRVDTRSGRPLLRADLGRVAERDTWTLMGRSVVVLSLRPLVVRLPGDGQTSSHGTFVAFDDGGQRRATIPLSQEDGCDLATEDFSATVSGVRRFANLPYRRLAVVGDALVTQCRDADDFSTGDRTVAFSLTDGHRLWAVKVPGETKAIGHGADRLFVVTHDMMADTNLTVFTLSPGTGRLVTTEAVDSTFVTHSGTNLFQPLADGFLVSPDDTHSTGLRERPAVRLHRQ